MSSLLRRVYFFTITVLLLAATGAAIYIWRLDYDHLIASIIANANKNGLEGKLRNQIFTRKRFLFLQRLAALIFIIAPFCFWLSLHYRDKISGLCKLLALSVWQCLKAVKQAFKDNSRGQNISVITLITVIVLFFCYHMITSFLTYDEMWSYNYYTANHFYYSFFTYSSYPLFEMSTHFFKLLPFPAKINLRLSPFIFGVFSCILLYACVRKYFNSHLIAMVGLTFFAFSPFTVQYFVSARGIMHELLFAILQIFSFLFWYADPGKKKWLVVYFVAAVLGLYSMVTHIFLLLFLMGFGIWTMIKKNSAAANWFLKINILALFVFSVFYVPILFTTGGSVYSDVIRNLPSYYSVLKSLPQVVLNLFMVYSGYTLAGTIIFITAVTGVILFKNRFSADRYPVLAFVIGLPLALIFFYFITGHMYPERAFAFMNLCLPLLACLGAEIAKPFCKEIKMWQNGVMVSLISMLLLLYSYLHVPMHSDIKKVVTVANLLIKNNITTCYDNTSEGNIFFYYYPGVEYYYRQEHRTIEFTLSAKKSMRYKPLRQEDKYDCIVYNASFSDSSRVKNFHELYIDPAGRFEIWVRNDLK